MTTPAKIEPWMIDAMKSLHCAEYYTDAMAERDARHVAAHAPKQEWEAKEKALRELADEWFHESLRKDVPLLTSMAIDKCRRQLRAILNREQEKP